MKTALLSYKRFCLPPKLRKLVDKYHRYLYEEFYLKHSNEDAVSFSEFQRRHQKANPR
ncbi:MAG TPA: hypothetical protein PLP33_28380 [Leptospiraceae bacterium]|nr:hypothetical protein [Leptospiraceae bacterium]